MKKIRYFITGSAFCLGASQIPGIQTLVHAESLSDRMANAGFNTVLGMGTVFLMLIVMALIIYAFRIIPVIQKKFSGKKTETQPAIAEEPQAVVPDEEELTDDLELVAVIAAAIAASEQVPVDSFRVRTIKRRR